MKRVLLTGMSGTDKSTVIEELAARGYKAVDTDYHGLSELVDVPDDDPTALAPGQDWLWREDRIQQLLSTHDVDVLFLGGCAPKPGKVLPTDRPHHPADRTRTRHRREADHQTDQSLRQAAPRTGPRTAPPAHHRAAPQTRRRPGDRHQRPLDHVVAMILRHVQAPAPGLPNPEKIIDMRLHNDPGLEYQRGFAPARRGM
ncbi:hypothetical protein Raf01_86020 [Rugosimonospora africana]|uniref:Shikimate kinase n=1 Tax=Rugosimonospora africana TaxID=556532 RepID=A0A8J3QZX7_9ACTN|nr:hypothetical protein Raf01_86020 [Rugosimonospora africana]